VIEPSITRIGSLFPKRERLPLNTIRTSLLTPEFGEVIVKPATLPVRALATLVALPFTISDADTCVVA